MLPTPQEVTPEDDQPLSAPYIVGLALLACIAVAATVILIIARGHEEDYVWPATTTAVAGLAGSLVAILLSPQTMVPRTQTGRRISIFTWALCALVGTATAIGVFVLASAAFPPARGPASFNYAGLALLGAVLGYLAATAVLLQRLGGSATYLGQLTSILERQAEQLFPSIAPVVERTFIDLIAGPPSPPYQGYVALDIRKGEASLGHAWGMDRDSADRTSSHIFVWFDTTSPKADARAPIRVPGNRWPNETDAEANDTSPSVEFEVLFHNASDPGSPQVNKIRTPVSGRSADIKFDTFDLRELPAVSDAYLEIRHASKMVQIVNLPKRGSADAKP